MSSHSVPPPRWLMASLMGCLCVILVFFLTRPEMIGQPAQAAEVSYSPQPTPTPTATLTASPTPIPITSPTPAPVDWSQPVAESDAVVQEDWFSNAVFIGDSRTDGLRLYSGITSKATFLEHTGLSVYDVIQGKEVIRHGSEKISILDALAQDNYGKVYISLGINELGYYDPEDFANTYSQIIDAVQTCQPDALIYIQSIFPVNTALCKSSNTPYYVTNEGITSYNAVLPSLCAEKEVHFLDIPDTLMDEFGESPAELSLDGVHYKRTGYQLWLEYLTTHTGF